MWERLIMRGKCSSIPNDKDRRVVGYFLGN
jgi:hypothetical protein